MNTRAERSSAFQNEVPNFVPGERANVTLDLQVTQDSRVRVANPSSRWVESLKDRFDKLASLPKGWDGYVGRPVSFTCAQFAANLIERLFDKDLPPPSLVPGSDGTLQIEWHRNNYDIEIDVLAPFEVTAMRFDLRSGQSEEIDLESDFTVLAGWIGDLKADRQQEAVAGEIRL